MSEERPLPALRIADKLTSLQADQQVYIDRDGRVVDRKFRRRRYAVYFGGLGAACTIALVLNPAFGLVYTGVLGAMVARRFRRAAQVERIPRLIRAQRFEEAERELAALEQRGQRAFGAYGRCLIACHRGQLDAALAEARRCEGLTRDRPRFQTLHWNAQFLLASLLLEQGLFGEGEAAVEAAMKAPDGEYYATLKLGLAVLRAFVTDQPESLGSDDELHDRVRVALRYNHDGMTVALLGWAYERRGDADMAAHMVAEAPARFLWGAELIERMHPRVWTWLGPKLAELAARGEDEA